MIDIFYLSRYKKIYFTEEFFKILKFVLVSLNKFFYVLFLLLAELFLEDLKSFTMYLDKKKLYYSVRLL